MTTRAQELRQTPTGPEQKLWTILHAFRQRGYHFRRQHRIAPYIVDFACIHGKLIIEADGDSHGYQLEYDRERDAFLMARGYRVLRFWNNDITGNAEGVFQRIEQALASVPPLTPTLDPSPSEGGGKPRLRKRRSGLKDLASRTGDA
jgi:very-short-patch-repair endonuclease